MQGGQLLPHGAALCGCVGVLMWFSGSRQRLIASWTRVPQRGAAGAARMAVRLFADAGA